MKSQKSLASTACTRLASLVFLLSPIAHAAESGTAEAWDLAMPYTQMCEDEGGGQLNYNICIGRELKLKQLELDSLYRQLSSALVEGKKFEHVQSEWIKYREAECALRVSGMAEDGSGTAAVRDACLLDMTIKRIKELALLKARSGCNGCPVLKKDIEEGIKLEK